MFFRDLFMKELYKAVISKLDEDDLKELDNYELCFDFGYHCYAETKEQYEEECDKIVKDAVKNMLDMYVVHIEDEIIQKETEVVMTTDDEI